MACSADAWQDVAYPSGREEFLQDRPAMTSARSHPWGGSYVPRASHGDQIRWNLAPEWETWHLL